ncbi:hypothetical protein JZ751_024022 [Albula glossodonta]|uniref:Fibrocystin-L n=1 Tax=Albula glossodonta TaxID=121402 RepID=A0A8T2NGQ5_9TELE|nr:hypothetical protein JZ751_024022 [Albula glossodonta]
MKKAQTREARILRGLDFWVSLVRRMPSAAIKEGVPVEEVGSTEGHSYYPHPDTDETRKGHRAALFDTVVLYCPDSVPAEEFKSAEVMNLPRKGECLLVASLFLWSLSETQRITKLTPHTGSLNGATRLTIEGEGFAQENQFNLDASNKDFGNTVYLVSDTRSIPCDVERDSTHGNQIMCYTRPMPHGNYEVRVIVDGVLIPTNRICNGIKNHYWCSFYPRWYRSPSISSISPLSGLPGTLVTLRGRIYTDVYGSNTDKSSNGLDVRVLRMYMGGMPCELLKPNSDDLSLPDKSVFTVSSLKKLAMFQTYAELNRVSPSAGSLEGGTILTIEGRFFDETDHPAFVLVGGQHCEILSLSDERITCMTPEHRISNMTVFPGGRGLKMEIWNDSTPNPLDDALLYDETRPGYSVHWVDSLSHTWPLKLDLFVSRLSGFIVFTETDNYTFYIRGDDRYALYFSQTGRPEDKVKIAFSNYYTTDFFRSTDQRSQKMRLEKGKPYYIEVFVHDYGGPGSVDVALFKEKSPFTAQQSSESSNEVQMIKATYDILQEQQVVSFKNWTLAEPVKEVQKITVNSSCFALSNCDYTFYRLTYKSQSTGPIPVSASAVDVQNGLNSMWAIKPDMVQVTKIDRSGGAEYTVVFNSERGDYQSLHYETAGANVNISVDELTKGKPSLETFTLEWGGISSRPLAFNSSESEVQSALESMVGAECPSEIQAVEDNNVKFFRDYEDNQHFTSDNKRGSRVSETDAFCGRWSLMNPEILFLSSDERDSGNAYGPMSLQLYSILCFAYKGFLKNEIGIEFSYERSTGETSNTRYRIPVLLNQGTNWSYICVDLLTPTQTEYPGSGYSLLEISLYKETSQQDFFVDAVHLGRSATTFDINAVVMTRKPPALSHMGLFVEQISVRKILQTELSCVSYEITASPFNCGHDFPLIAVGFLQVVSSSEDTAAFSEGMVGVTVTRTQRASPPLTGTFDAEIYGKHIEGLAVDITAEDLQYTLQGIPEMGQVQVSRSGSCKGYNWRVEWQTNPGAQPLIQVEVFINGISSKCSGDCGFEWSEVRTPKMTGISPTQGSYALDTVVTITGSGFSSENVTVLIGHIKCTVLQVDNSSLTCRVGNVSAGTYPVSLSFAGLGHTQYSGNTKFNFTSQMGVFSISPASGSIAGGTLLTVIGYGFGRHTMVLVGMQTCAVVSVHLDQIQCRTPPGMAGAHYVSLETPEMSVSASDPFIYNASLTPVIISMHPLKSTVLGHTSLTIQGTNFEGQGSYDSVFIGETECRIEQWSSSNITCLLPQLPPAMYEVHVQVGTWGYATTNNGTNATIEYILEVTSVSPMQGSLYGGTKVTIGGSGFSSSMSDNRVSMGGTWCDITFASENQLECVTESKEQTHTVTNRGSHPSYGEGYAWSPSSLLVSAGDTVVWRWETPSFISGVGYRVFSVSSPSSTTYDGLAFTSGDTKTASGFFSYRFTAPGTYYYSSGYVDSINQKFLQGVVKVQPLEDRSSRLSVTVVGIEAKYMAGVPHRNSRSVLDCISSVPECSQNSDPAVPVDGFSFSFLECLSPAVYDIWPESGTRHDVIHIEGFGFSNTTCANEVTVGGSTCHVINSTSDKISCHLWQDNGLEAGVAHLVSVRVNNFGKAINIATNEFHRRFVVLPVVDSVTPNIGATTGNTRLTIQGSAFSAGPDTIVSVAGMPCLIWSINYMAIVCDTSPASARTGEVVVHVGGIATTCHSTCTFQYSSNLVPQVMGVFPDSIFGNSTMVTILGSGFSNSLDDVEVFAGDMRLWAIDVTDTNITLDVGPMTAGDHVLKVVISSKGLASGSATLRSLPHAMLAPSTGSTNGGTALLITGNGFLPGNTSVMVGNSPCQLQWVRRGEMSCLTPAHSEGSVAVHIRSLGTVITISGSGFGTDQHQVFVTIGGARCNVSAFTNTDIQCTVGERAGGTFPVLLHHTVKGYANSQSTFNYHWVFTEVTPDQGGFGGGSILSVHGSGFDTNSAQVLICGKECEVQRERSTSYLMYCKVPSNNGTEAQLDCSVEVLQSNGTARILNAFSYKSLLTPVIMDVSPRRGGTAGGTRLTITGSNFSSNSSEIMVTIAGSLCSIDFANNTHIICITSAQPRSQLTTVQVNIEHKGLANMDNADFFYIDVWSSKYTWSGLSPPEAGTFAVITKGQTILLDTSTPVLKMLLIQGGTLVFDEADIELQAENILITDGGTLQIGTETAPFQHKAIITLHGHLRSQELPVYGTKTLAVREGILDLHGIPVPVPWTHLAETALAGSTTLTLRQSVTWNVGDEIVIASTGHRHSQRENEARRIAAVSADGRTLTLTEPLTYTHLGVSVTLPDGTVFEGRAEVGLLTRNVVVRGSNNLEWNDRIEACPDGFNTGEFATQTCFQGRFGEEIGSDHFGGCIMFHAPRPSENLAVGRVEHVEIFHAGQAFRLGRYPIHWHLMGDLHYKSYVRGCAIHQTYNRAVTIHNTHNLLVERNVIYDIMGGAFFIEDGIETGNVLQYNLAVFVKQSTSLLNDDVTPAAYWVTNPNNIIRHNAAAGGTHFGFWYRMHNHPDGPSYDPKICQKRVPLGEFFNNTVHSQGWFGLWIFQEYFPMKGGRCNSRNPEPAIFRALTTWNCEKGAEWVNVGAVQFSNFLMVNNEKAGIEAKRIIYWAISGWGEEGGAVVNNSTIVGHIDELGLGVDYCSTRGVVLPLDDGMSVISTNFVNFNKPSCAAIGVARIDGTCVDRCGGWSARFSGIRYFNSTNKGSFRWEHEVVLIDSDGSLTGNADHKVVPMSSLLDPGHCSQDAAWSTGFPGAVCDHTVNFHRLAFNNPSPSSLRAKDVILTNSHGSCVIPYLKKRMTHKLGWMALLPSLKTYTWYFDLADHITNISYNAKFYGFKQQDYIIIKHNLTQKPDRFRIVDERNASAHALDFSSNINGDWYFNETSKNVYYMVSGKHSLRRRRASVDPAVMDVVVNFQVYRCFFKDCIPPPQPPPATLSPVPSRRPANFVYWSNESFWKSSPENKFSMPVEGDDVIIPPGVWLVMDVNVPSLRNITVLGILEILDTMNDTSMTRSIPQYRKITLSAIYISIQGGKLIAGWPDDPFKGELQIILRGNHLTPDWPLPSGPNQGSKVLGVFGDLDLYGMPHTIYHTKLASTASAGSSTLSLQEAVDWQVGDEVVISTTSYDLWETETRRIAAISVDGRTLTLNRSLSYTHIGESYSISGSVRQYRLAADVGLLSRNIKITGEDYPGLSSESFGARVLVSSFSNGGITFRGSAQIRNVEFYHTGQEGWVDFYDPRYSVAFLNLGDASNNDSYIQGCAFHHGFSPAIGVFETDGLSVDDNVIYFTVGEGIRVWGNNNRVRRNLVTMSLWPGSYQGRAEAFNYEWNAAIEVSEGRNVVLQDNIVAGFQRVAYRIDGEPCPGMWNPVEMWFNNEAHGGLYGVYMNKDGLPHCSLIQGFTAWRCFDFGIYAQVTMSVQIRNISLIDNGMGIFSIIFTPPSLSHQYSNKTVHIQDALIVGSSPDFNCSQGLPSSDANVFLSNSHRAVRPPNGGRSGICWPTFASGHNNAPQKPHNGLMSYNAISGLLTVTDTMFVGFKSVCSGEMNVMFITNPKNEDLQHPVHVERLTLVDSMEEAKVHIQRADVGKVNPSDCVDMECDAKKKALLKDLDGSFLGAMGAVVPQSEYEWDGDSRRGLGDYRIPKVMLTFLNGSRIPVEKIAPNKGIIRDSTCTYMSQWQSYKCFGLNYKMLVIESLDSDTETRRLSPVAVLGDSYVDLLNGPQDHGWCAGYTCQERVSLFHSIVATNKSFDIYFTSTTPQKLRFMLLNADSSETVRVAVFYSNPQRLDVYINDNLIAPTNALWNDDHSEYTLKEPSHEGQYIPQLNSTHGANYFDSTYKMLNILLRGSTPVVVHTSPLLFIAFRLPAMTVDEFYGESLVRNLALFLKVPANMIRITKVIREDSARRRRRSTGLTVEVEISQPPAQQSSNSTGEEEFSTLQNIADSLGQAAVSGNLSQSIGFNVSSVGIVPPPPPPTDPEWSEVASEEVSREEPTLSFVTSVAKLMVVVQPMSSGLPGLLVQQPCVMALDEEDNCVSVGVTSLTLTAALKRLDNRSESGLQGNTTVSFKSCWANFTDLSISTAGENMRMVFTLNAIEAQSRSLTVKAATTANASPTVSTTFIQDTTEFDFLSIFDSAAPVKSGILCLFAFIFSVSLMLLNI